MTHVERIILIIKLNLKLVGREADAAVRTADRNNKQAIFKNCTPFTDCINEINNTQVDNGKGCHADI